MIKIIINIIAMTTMTAIIKFIIPIESNNYNKVKS